MADDWAISRFKAFAALGEVARAEGDAPPTMYLLHSGWTASSIVVAGGARQMIKVHLPGDLLGLPSLAFAQACDTIHALSPAVVSIVEPRAISQIFESSPRLAALLFLLSQEERVRLMDRLASIGRTDAIGRVAALILHLHARVQCNQPDADDTFHAPLTQADLADLTGLSKVHVNRTLQQLRGDKIVRWSSRSVTILDPDRLKELAQIPPRILAKDLAWLPAG